MCTYIRYVITFTKFQAEQPIVLYFEELLNPPYRGIFIHTKQPGSAAGWQAKHMFFTALLYVSIVERKFAYSCVSMQVYSIK